MNERERLIADVRAALSTEAALAVLEKHSDSSAPFACAIAELRAELRTKHATRELDQLRAALGDAYRPRLWSDGVTAAPGSLEAQACGCVCPRVDNCYGRGYRYIAGEPQEWIVTVGCPLHHAEDT